MENTEMNANELADSLDVESSQAEYGYIVDDWKLFRDAATMLRQQQDKLIKYELRHAEQRKRIEELERIIQELTQENHDLWEQLHGESFDRTASHMAGEYVAHPVKELNDGGEPVKNATYWKRQYNLMATQNDNLKSGLYHANEQIKYLESNPPKDLTDEEITELENALKACDYKYFGSYAFTDEQWDAFEVLEKHAKAILRKAQEK